MRIFTKRDVVIAILAFSIPLVFVFLKNGEGYSKRVVVEISGEVYEVIDRPGRYPVVVNGRRITTVVYDGNRVRVVDSDCPLKICEKMGWIEPGGEIICVPNKLVVRFERSEIDAMTW